MSVRARAVAAGLAGCAAIVAAGCGSSPSTVSSSSSPAKEPASAALVSSMQDSVRHASSVHVDGRLISNGTPGGVSLDLTRSGDMAGSITQSGASVQVVGVGGKVYLKPTPAYLKAVRAPASACASVCGKWTPLPSQQASQLLGDFSMNSMTGPLTSSQVPAMTEAGTATISGQAAYVLRAAGGIEIDISSAGQHFPLLASTGGSTPEVVRYSKWDSVPQPAPPPVGQVLKPASGP